MQRLLFFGLFLALGGIPASAQSSDREVIDIRERMPDLFIEAPYTGPDNFFREKLYTVDKHTAYGTLGAVKGLEKVRADLKAQGYDLKVWDFYRPLAVQWLMWEKFPDPTFVADPRNGSNHNRAAAVDVTLLDLATGMELDMGTDFDDFSERADHGFEDLPLEVRLRRNTLRQVMDTHNFSSFFAEWWHYTHNPSANVSPLFEYQMK